MEQAKINMRRSSTLRTDKEKLAADDRKDSTNTVPPTPIDAPTDGYLPAAQQGSLQPDPEIPNDAPPSYDEAMSSECLLLRLRGGRIMRLRLLVRMRC